MESRGTIYIHQPRGGGLESKLDRDSSHADGLEHGHAIPSRNVLDD